MANNPYPIIFDPPVGASLENLPDYLKHLPHDDPSVVLWQETKIRENREYTYCQLVGFYEAPNPAGRPVRSYRPAPQPPIRTPEATSPSAASSPPVSGVSSSPILGSPFTTEPATPLPSRVKDIVNKFTRTSPKEVTVQVTDLRAPPDSAFKRVFGLVPKRLTRTETAEAVATPVTTTHLLPSMKYRKPYYDINLVPEGSEFAEPTVRGIIEEYYEDKEFEKKWAGDDGHVRTPMFSSPKQPGSPVKIPRRTKSVVNDNSFADPGRVRIPPKAKQILGSPTLTAKRGFFERGELSPLHLKSKSLGSLKHSASTRVAGLLSPNKAAKSSRPSIERRAKDDHDRDSAAHTTILGSHDNESSLPSKFPFHLSSSSFLKNKMAPSHSPTKEPSTNASPRKSQRVSPTKHTSDRVSPRKSLLKMSRSPVKDNEGFSIKRTLSNALTPKMKKPFDLGPTPPEKDTPPELKPSATITEVGGDYADDYTAQTPSAAAHKSQQRDKSATTGVREAPRKHVRVNTAEVLEAPYPLHSPSKAEHFYADAETAREIAEEFQTPPLPTQVFHSPRPGDEVEIDEDDYTTPKHDTSGLVGGKFLPATKYKPPQEQVVHSPSIYSAAADGIEVQREVLEDENDSTHTPVPPNSPVRLPLRQAEKQGNSSGIKHAMDMMTKSRAPVLQPTQGHRQVTVNGAIYHPAPGETPILSHDFASTIPRQVELSTQQAVNAWTYRGAATSTPQSNLTFNGITYEHPSAVPPPLRRTSRESNHPGSSSPPSLRDQFYSADEQGGLGIDLSEGSGDYVSTGTNMATHGSNGSSASLRKKWLRARSEENNTIRAIRGVNDRSSEMHIENAHRLAILSNRVDRLVRQNTQLSSDVRCLRNAMEETATRFTELLAHEDHMPEGITNSVVDRLNESLDHMGQQQVQLSTALNDRFSALEDRVWQLIDFMHPAGSRRSIAAPPRAARFTEDPSSR